MLVALESFSRLCDMHARDVDIPAIDVVTLGQGMHNARVDGVAVDDCHLGEPNAFLKAGRGLDAGNHHEFGELLALEGQLAPLRLLETVFGRGNVLGGEGLEELWWW